MTHLQAYWSAARSSSSYWQECDYAGHRLVLATFEWPPKDIPNCTHHTRHILFSFEGLAGEPSRSISYEPSSSGAGFFLGQASADGVRINHGNIPQMTRDEFVAVALEKLFGPLVKLHGSSLPQPSLSPQASKAWWKVWK